jgi:fructose-1,6-bisphosphatase/inositol monophosphatase family enzyme
MMIRGEIDAVFFINCPLSTWDSCAGEAIILGMKGILTKPDNTNIKY